MKTNGNIKNCGFTVEVVSYLYDELAAGERSTFETHLASCSTCTDEFAGMSNARFSVFEWKREEFEPLATPRFSLPHDNQLRVSKPIREGWFAGLRDALLGWPAIAGVAAAVLVTIAASFFAFNYSANDHSASVKPAIIESPKVVTPQSKTEEKVVAVTTPTPEMAETKTKANREIRPVRAADIDRKPRRMRNLTAETLTPENIRVEKPAQKAPALSTLEEDDDRSLRLSDLFEEGGV